MLTDDDWKDEEKESTLLIDIQIQSRDGIVTLTGTVSEESDDHRGVQIDCRLAVGWWRDALAGNEPEQLGGSTKCCGQSPDLRIILKAHFSTPLKPS
jgi:hypothetical protein